MVLLAIKELASSAEDIIMVTSTVMKDTGGSTEAIYRPNAIRALCRIIDVGSGSGFPSPLLSACSHPLDSNLTRHDSRQAPCKRSNVS